MPPLYWTDVLFSWLAMGLHILWCAQLNRELAWTWLWSSARAGIQLVMLGYVLVFLFSRNHWVWNTLTLGVMVIVSALTIASRAGARRSELAVDSLTAIAVTLLIVLLPVAAWTLGRGFTEASFLIPFIGILLGNSLSGISLGISQWHRELAQRRQEIEYWLAVGATPAESVRELQSSILKTAMTVVLNSMAVSGIVSIPGQMTGQLLARGKPDLAVRYQLMILFLISCLVFLSTWMLLKLRLRRNFDAWGALSVRSDRDE